MKKHAVKITLYSLLAIAFVILIGIAATWKHWWWPVNSAKVWIDSKLSDRVQVYRGYDGRYMLYYDDLSKDWSMTTVVVPGRWEPVDNTSVCNLLKEHHMYANVYLLPFEAYSIRTPIETGMLYAISDLKDVPNLKYSKNGFSFINMNQNNHHQGRSRTVQYRVELK